MNAKKGFTLVEILIVVVILGILAAIVIPQFTNASTEAKENSLKSDLHTMRAQLELYKVRYNQDEDANSLGDLVTAEYLREIPTNPFNGLDTVNDGSLSGSCGWAYIDGDIFADDGGSYTDPDGVTTAHSEW